MSYKPPFARMREIRQNRPLRASQADPVNVEDALDRMPVPVFVVEEPEQPSIEEPAVVITQPEPVVEVETIEPEPVVEVEAIEPVVAEPEVIKPVRPIKFNPQAKKADLIALARSEGLVVDDTMTKAQIIVVLQAAQ